MFIKSIDQLEYSDIYNLVIEQRHPEGSQLDYKLKINGNDNSKRELAKDMSSFANSGGGFLIIGVTDDYEINGIEDSINNTGIVEWINTVAGSNINPRLQYPDPVIISIDNSEKVIVVIEIPESNDKPHMVSSRHQYFIRTNDRSMVADHFTVRDLFNSSRRIEESYSKFLQDRNLLNSNDINFGKSTNLNSIKNHQYNEGETLSYVLFNAIPRNILHDKYHFSTEAFIKWADKNAYGFHPLPNKHLYHGHFNTKTHIDGVTFFSTSNNIESSYMEILNNGFIQAGLSQTFSGHYNDSHSGRVDYITLTELIGYEYLFLNWLRHLYRTFEIYDEVVFKICLTNVLNKSLKSFHKTYDGQFRREYSAKINKYENNIVLDRVITPYTLSDAEILDIVQFHSLKLCNAFGYPADYGFVNGELDLNLVDRFQL